VKITEQTESRMVARRSPLGQALGGLVPFLLGVLLLTQATAGTFLVLIMALAFTGVGLLSIIGAQRGTIAVDKPSGTVSLTLKSLLSAKDTRTVNIADIDRLTYSRLYANGFASRGSRRNDCILVLKDGSCEVLPEDIGLNIRVMGFVAFSRPADRKFDSALAQFMGVPLVEHDGPGFAGATVQEHVPAGLAPAQWYPDPAGRHDHRYWDGLQWTANVADHGKQGVDPLPEASSVPTA
jgi:Protein of unknown function (DUF2510)